MRVSLVMKTEALCERPFVIRGSRTVIGRAVQADLRVPLPSVELRHCELRLERDRLTVTDLGSACGIFRNGERVDHAVLRHDDELTIGPVTFRVRILPNGAMTESASAEMRAAHDALIESRGHVRAQGKAT